MGNTIPASVSVSPDDMATTTIRSRRYDFALVGGLCFLPILMSPLPPIIDYPNHLARIWLLGGGASNPPLSSIYEVRWWQASTNIAVDALGAAASTLLPLQWVSYLLLALMFCLPAMAALALNRRIFDSYTGWWPAFVAIAWNSTAVAGFMSFQISLGCALAAAAVAERYRGRAALNRTLLDMVLAGGVLLIHPFGWVYYLALRGGLTLGAGNPFPVRTEMWLAKGAKLALLALACALPFVLLVTLAPSPPRAGSGTIIWWSGDNLAALKHVVAIIASPVITYDPLIDFLTISPFVIAVGWYASRRRLMIHFGLLATAAGLLIAGYLSPNIIGDASFIQFRFPVMALFAATAAIRPISAATGGNRDVHILAVCAAARMAWLAFVAMSYSRDVQTLEDAAAKIPPGSAVLVADAADMNHHRGMGSFVFGMISSPALMHAASMIVPWRQSFIPTLFRVPGQHAIGVKADWEDKAASFAEFPNTYQLNAAVACDPVTTSRYPYLKSWPTKFDYLILLDAMNLPDPPLASIRRIMRTEAVALYKIDRLAATTGSAPHCASRTR